jgi:hypothetical protein
VNNKATLLLTLAAFIVLASCAKSSTGRNQITLFSSSDLNKMGDSSFEQMKKKSAVILR